MTHDPLHKSVPWIRPYPTISYRILPYPNEICNFVMLFVCFCTGMWVTPSTFPPPCVLAELQGHLVYLECPCRVFIWVRACLMDYNDRSCAGNALHNKAHSAIWVLSSEPNTPHRHLEDWLLCSSGVSRNWGIYAACLFQVDLVSLSINMGRCNMAACCVSMNNTGM